MTLQDPPVPASPPETSAYYYAAYAVLALLYLGYVFSLWWRARKTGTQ